MVRLSYASSPDGNAGPLAGAVRRARNPHDRAAPCDSAGNGDRQQAPPRQPDSPQGAETGCQRRSQHRVSHHPVDEAPRPDRRTRSHAHQRRRSLLRAQAGPGSPPHGVLAMRQDHRVCERQLREVEATGRTGLQIPRAGFPAGDRRVLRDVPRRTIEAASATSLNQRSQPLTQASLAATFPLRTVKTSTPRKCQGWPSRILRYVQSTVAWFPPKITCSVSKRASAFRANHPLQKSTTAALPSMRRPSGAGEVSSNTVSSVNVSANALASCRLKASWKQSTAARV